jgi:hypothetical protein
VGLLGGIPPVNVGLGGLVLILVLLWATGKIPTLRELRDSQRREERAMALAETWQKVATEHGMTLEKHTAALEQLLTYAETTHHVVTEIQRAGAGSER